MSNLCDYRDASILLKRDVTVESVHPTQAAFKNCAPFAKCITKIDETTIDDAEDLDLVMPMYNLLEYSSNYSDTACSLWFNFEDEATNFDADISNDDAFI